MLNFINKLLTIGSICGISIFVYTACKQPIPDMIGLRILVWCLMIFGIIQGIKHWND